MGNADFQKRMNRNEFKNIRTCLSFYEPDMYDHDNSSKDPLWHSQNILDHFVINASSIAVPSSVRSLDETTERNSTGTAAKTYMPAKPKMVGLRMYAVLEYKSRYIHSIFDNRDGNVTGLSRIFI